MTNAYNRTALDWWQLLPQDQIKDLMRKYFPLGKIESELTIGSIVSMWAQETDNTELLVDAEISEGEVAAAELQDSIEQEIFDIENP